jgi:foldase protein PrsA
MLYWPRARQREETAANGAFSMKRLALLALVLLVLVVTGCGGSSSSASLGADDVAVAGSKDISKEQFQAAMARAKRDYVAAKRPFPTPGTTAYEQLKGQAVTFLVIQAELEQEAEDMGVDLSDERVDQRLEKLKQECCGGDQARYEKTIKQQGLTDEQARGEVRVLLVQEGLTKKITEDVKATKDEIRADYDSHKSQYQQPESREVRHILVEKKPLADQIYTQLKSGANFATLAKKYSKDPGSAANGGKLTVSKGQTVPEFDKKTFELKKGELSQPVKTQYGYHIIQALSDVKPATKTPLSKVEGSIKQQLEKQQKDEALAKWLEDMKKSYCKGKIKYQVGYQPSPDPCLASTGTATTDR